MKTKKSWQLKMLKPAEPVIEQGPEEWNARYGGTKMVIPTPILIDKLLRQLPPGHKITMGELRDRIAQECGADYACPLTTGIFFRIVAEASEEREAEGKGDPTPWWRVVPDKGKLNPKLPGGGPLQSHRLAAEGL